MLMYFASMKRRMLLFLPFACARPAHAGLQPWSAELLHGGFDGQHLWAGLQVSLFEGWKTYWRVPGDGGIAPDFNISGDNIKSAKIEYPLPQRFESADGATIGYKHDVVFPVAIEVEDASKVTQLMVKSFFGVCKDVCTPAKFEHAINFDPAHPEAPDQIKINTWRAMVPASAQDPMVLKAQAEVIDAKVMLVLELREAVRDIFVEGKPAHYFGKPNLMRNVATLTVSGAKSVADLMGSTLRITIDTGNQPLEQTVTLV
jgi:DsbC/DsbD-like thiol-disulfide interchange protein